MTIRTSKRMKRLVRITTYTIPFLILEGLALWLVTKAQGLNLDDFHLRGIQDSHWTLEIMLMLLGSLVLALLVAAILHCIIRTVSWGFTEDSK